MKKYLNILYLTFLSICITSCGGEMDENNFSGDYKMVITTEPLAKLPHCRIGSTICSGFLTI